MPADSGRKAAVGPLDKNLGGWRSVEVGIKGRAVGEKIKKPSDSFVGEDCVAQQERWYLDPGRTSVSNQYILALRRVQTSLVRLILLCRNINTSDLSVACLRFLAALHFNF